MARKKNPLIPTRASLIEATFVAIKQCDNSATNAEIHEKIIEIMNLSDDVITLMNGKKTEPRLKYELRWARTYMKRYGVITDSTRGVWSITQEFSNKEKICGEDIVSKIREWDALKNNEKQDIEKPNEKETKIEADTEEIEVASDDEPWRSELADLLKKIDPFVFEKLTARLLRECGFIKLVVTKKTGDGGIDGYGKVRLNELVTLDVAFQCKRYSSKPVSSPEISAFRGSLPAGIKNGLFVTTGTFTKEAIQNAADYGKDKEIDLIDGETFIDLLLEHHLGVKENISYEIDKEFFAEI